MVCPRCGSSSLQSGRCASCGAAIAQTTVVADVVPFDTTGLPPGATFGATLEISATTTDGTAAPTAPDIPPIPTAGGPLKVGQAFGPRYHIIKLLGTGGMGAVYQAWDSELSVAVAVKVIRVDKHRGSVSAEAEKRFKNELLLARQVTHKNVVRIHDLDEIDGIKYITMSYVQGDDLGTVLRHEGKLPIARALRLARQIVAGLEAAHEASVVHRDLKPPNIMVGADDLALIMDFGISASRDETVTGRVVGTLEYMAPEQSKGDAVDARADIYAFGLILYEMLAGLRAAPSSSAQERIDAMKQRVVAGLPPVRALDESIPEPLDAIVMRCLAIDPAARYQKTSELAAALARLDDHGHLIPEARRITKPLLAAAISVVAAMLAATYFTTRQLVTPPEAHAIVPVLIADFDNRTGDPVFDKAVEQALAVSIEGASFISSYPHRDAERVAAQLQQGATRLDENLARLVSLHEGIKVVLAGSIARRGTGYALAVKAVDPGGETLTTATADARSKEDVLKSVARLGVSIRRALGDTTTKAPPDAETLTASSLEAVRLYSVARDLESKYQVEAALSNYKRAVSLDPAFGRAYAGWANAAFRLGRVDESQAAWKQALALTDRMTDREKYRTLGLYYGTASRNYEQAIDNYKTLIDLYPADGAGHNNLAVAYFNTLDFQRALQEGRRVLEIYPKTLLYRGNYALYAMYASDFRSAAAEATRITTDDPKYYPAYLPIAVASLEAKDAAMAADAYDRMAEVGPAPASTATLGLADLALYQSRADDAIAILKRGIAADIGRSDKAGLAAKYVALAEAYEMVRRPQEAARAARDAMAASPDLESALAARVLARMGGTREAAAVAMTFTNQLQPQKRAYAKLLDGELKAGRGATAEAVDAFQTAKKIADLWLVRFDLGVAFVQAGQYAEAISEFDACQKRRGEAVALLLDDRPTFRYLATLPYWLARAQEGLGMSAAAKANYTSFLADRLGPRPDPLATDAARRLSAAR